MNSGEDFQMQKNPSSKLTLTITGLGHVPSFKNGKMLARGRLITNPKKQEWMKQCIASFQSQFVSLCPTIVGATLTESLAQFLIASLPQDDCWQSVPELNISVNRVGKGKEGAVIEITNDPSSESAGLKR